MTLNRKQAPPFQALSSFTLPDATQLTTASGIPILGLAGVQQEVVKIDWVFDAGRWRESVAGSSHFVSLLLDKGTASRPAAAIASALEGLGAQVECSAGADYFFVSLYALSKNWLDAFAIVSDMLTNATFPHDELSLQKTITRENIRVNREKTSYLAAQALRAAVFGSSHPYGSTLEEKQVIGIERSHLVALYERFQLLGIFAAVPGTAYLDQLASRSGHWPAARQLQDFTHSVTAGAPIQHLAKEGSIQNSIRLGKRTIGRHHPDYGGLLLVNHLLGGFFGSRLMKNIREKKGLTYGIHASVQPYRHDSLWSISADVNKVNLEIARAEIQNEMQELADAEVSDAELQVCKNHFLGALVADVGTPFSVMEKMRTVFLHGLPQNHYQHLFDTIRQIDRARFREVARRYLAGPWHHVSVG